MKDNDATLTMVKQKVFELPEDRLQEVYDFLDFILSWMILSKSVFDDLL
jgi:hypothetical protein